jgi:hypothetical protein
MLDSKTPNVKVIAYGQDNVDNETAVDAHGKSQTTKYKRNLIHIVSQRARPADAKFGLQHGTQRIDDSVEEWYDDDVPEWETRLGQVGYNHLTDTVSIYNADEEDERDKVVVQDDGVEG